MIELESNPSSPGFQCLDFLQISYAEDLKETSPASLKSNKTKARTKHGKNNQRLSSKTMVHDGNKYYLFKKTQRTSWWNCSTSRFTNCTAQLKTSSKRSEPIAIGSHDHANNTE